jgi:23S rRNA-/tRNA-specific pseudouridylate synthase
MMVEAQEGLPPKSLTPCHRIDRVTSGMTLCCTNVKVARLIQGRIEEGSVQKQYLAKVHGKFPSSSEESKSQAPTSTTDDVAHWKWCDDGNMVKVEGPIETVDPANGIRKITAKGKKSQSLFQFLSHNAETNTSMISCSPLTGRSHQLRVHLQWLGFSIVDDVQYGGSRDSTSLDPKAGIQRISESMLAVADDEQQLKAMSLSLQDVEAARQLCRCCQDVASAFTPAQLLQGGHEVCLHAYRYRIPFKRVKKKSKAKSEEESSGEPLAVVDFQVGLPNWATIGRESLLENLPWPNTKS